MSNENISTRQAKYYAKNKEIINAKRREKYRECVAKCYAEANEGYEEVFVPDKPLFTVNNKKVVDLSKHKTLSYDEIVKYLDELNLNPATATKYKEDIKRFIKITKCDDVVKCLKRSDVIINDIENGKMKNGNFYSNNTRKGLYQSILFIIDRFNLKINKQPYKLKFEEGKLQSIEDNDKMVYEKPVMKFSKFIEKVKHEFGEDSKMYAIVKLYDEVPMRDNLQLKIVDRVKDANDNTINYIVMYPSKQSKVIINRHKTDKLYGSVKVTVSQTTTKLVKDYMKNNSIQVGDYLFGSDKLSSYITSYNKKLGIEKGFNTFRHMKISEELEKVKSIPERQILATSMGHSPLTQLKYVRNLIKE